jgi:hypothetical protein
MKSFFIIFFALFCASFGAQVQLTPSEDTYAAQNVACGSSTCCFNGGSTTLHLGVFSILETDTWVQFDVSSLSGVTITSANLTLTQCGFPGLPSTHSIRFEESGLFDENTLSWSPAVAPGCPNRPTTGTSLGTSTPSGGVISKMVKQFEL